MKNKTKGVLLIIVPIVMLAFILFAYAFLSFKARLQYTPSTTSMSTSTLSTSSIGLDTDLMMGKRSAAIGIANVVLSLLGLVATVGIMIGIPMGIYFLVKKDEELTPEYVAKQQQNPKYSNTTVDQIKFIRDWSWGAFFSVTIWAIANRLYLWALGSLVPFFNLYVWLKLSASGRQLAWEKSKWDNYDQFRTRQTIAAWIIMGVLLVYIILNLLPLFLVSNF